MEEKKIVYDVILSIWNLAKEHGFDPLTDDQWESFIEKGNEEYKKYSDKGDCIAYLFRGMFDALCSYYERKSKNERALHSNKDAKTENERRC